jgi:hypothetical protein
LSQITPVEPQFRTPVECRKSTANLNVSKFNIYLKNPKKPTRNLIKKNSSIYILREELIDYSRIKGEYSLPRMDSI